MSSSTFYIASQQEDLRDSGMGEVPKHLSVFTVSTAAIFSSIWVSERSFGVRICSLVEIA